VEVVVGRDGFLGAESPARVDVPHVPATSIAGAAVQRYWSPQIVDSNGIGRC